MPTELEAKIKVPDHQPLRRKLHELGAKSIGQFHETNIFFDRSGDELRKSGRGLRIRINRNVTTGGEEAIVTYKGPRQPGNFKNREELETTVSDGQQAEAILQAIGFQRTLTFDKRRESWKLNNCKIELDEVPHLGTFLEIEGPDERSITAVQQKLSAEKYPHITDSYASMLSDWLAKSGRTDRTVTFADA